MEHYREFQQPPSPSPVCRVSFLPDLLLDSAFYHVKDSAIKRWKKDWATNRNLKHWEKSSEQEVRPMESQGRERLGIPFRTIAFALFIYVISSPWTKLSLLFLNPQSNLYPHPIEKPEHSLRHTIGSRMFRYCFGFKSWKKKAMESLCNLLHMNSQDRGKPWVWAKVRSVELPRNGLAGQEAW